MDRTFVKLCNKIVKKLNSKITNTSNFPLGVELEGFASARTRGSEDSGGENAGGIYRAFGKN